jgi:DNA polymerase III subunit gamma/tau
VIDRCHRFDFHRPTVEQIASVVRRTAQAESIEIPPQAVAAVARSATGSFRDALGTLEQLVTYSGPKIELEDVLAVLGVADASLLGETIDAIDTGDARRALKALEGCVEQGRDAASFASDLEVRARELLVVQTLGEVPAELSLTPEADAALTAQAERVEHAAVVRLLELLGAALEAVRAGADARTRLELALVKAAKPEVDGSTRALLARIERLERGGVSAVADQREVTPDEGHRPVGQAPPAPSPPAESAAAPDATLQPDTDTDSLATATLPPVEGLLAAGGIESVSLLWPAVVDLVRGENALLGALIAEAQPVDLDGEELTVAFSSSAPFLRKKASDPLNRTAVTEALRVITGVRFRLSYELREDLAPQERAEPVGTSEDDWVRRFKEEFDAEEVPGEWEPTQEGAPARGRESDLEAATSEEKGP